MPDKRTPGPLSQTGVPQEPAQADRFGQARRRPVVKPPTAVAGVLQARK